MRSVPLGSQLFEPKLLSKISWWTAPLLPSVPEAGCRRCSQTSVLAPIALAPTAAQMPALTHLFWTITSPIFCRKMVTIALGTINSLSNLSSLICHCVMNFITKISRSRRTRLRAMSRVLFVPDIAAFFVSSSISHIHEKKHLSNLLEESPRMPDFARVAIKSSLESIL